MPTLFERMWHGEVSSLPILQSEKLGSMAILANPQETIGQVVLFPKRPTETVQQLTFGEAESLLIAGRAITKHMQSTLGVQRVVEHVEGYGVPSHAHVVLLPSYQRGDSDRIHHPSERMDPDEFAEKYSAIQQQLTVPEDLIAQELAAREAYVQGLFENAT